MELFVVLVSAKETCHGCDLVMVASHFGGQLKTVTSNLQMS